MESFDILRQGELKSRSTREFIIENDNPVWSTLIRFGVAIRIEDYGPQYQSAHRVASFSRADENLELRLAHGRHMLQWNDCTFEVVISSEESREQAHVYMHSDDACIAFTDFIKHAREYARRKGGSDVDKLVVKVMRAGGWKIVSSYPKRPVDSLITGDSTVQDLLSDMKRFVTSEEEYVRFGMPFKRNYLIIGPPGSGKSSLLTIAASELDLDLCYISVTAGMCEKELCAAIGALTDNSMLVLEDADVLCSIANGGNSGGQTALAVLTNVLDGTLHRHKLITVLTSANPQALESVLTRHGRVDYTSRLTPLTESKVEAMTSYAFKTQLGYEQLAKRIWSQIERLGDVSSTVLAHFLFKHRHLSPNEIDETLCQGLSNGTHTVHINDANPNNSCVMYM